MVKYKVQDIEIGVSMGKIIALVNQKGGVGKTTSSINLSASLGVLKKKVLLVDLDPQGNTTTGIGVDKGEIKHSVYDLLIDNAGIQEVMLKTSFTNLYALPATINLAGADIELMEKSRLNPSFNKGGQLKKYLDQVKIGDKVEVYSNSKTKKYIGYISFISSTAEFTPKTIETAISF